VAASISKPPSNTQGHTIHTTAPRGSNDQQFEPTQAIKPHTPNLVSLFAERSQIPITKK
jgi:hypothetical protein